MTRECMLHGVPLNGAGDCPTCLRLEQEYTGFVDGTVIVTLNPDSRRALDQAVERAKSYPRRRR